MSRVFSDLTFQEVCLAADSGRRYAPFLTCHEFWFVRQNERTERFRGRWPRSFLCHEFARGHSHGSL